MLTQQPEGQLRKQHELHTMYTVTLDKTTRKASKRRSNKIGVSKIKYIMLSIKWILRKIQKEIIIIHNLLILIYIKHILQPQSMKYNKSANFFQTEYKFNHSLHLFASILLEISNSDFMRVFVYEELLMSHNREC